MNINTDSDIKGFHVKYYSHKLIMGFAADCLEKLVALIKDARVDLLSFRVVSAFLTLILFLSQLIRKKSKQ